MQDPDFSNQLITWFQRHGRKNLPWQKKKTAYRIWVSEIMLQQTQVKTVIPYFIRFMHRFPTVSRLASAELDEVLECWAGLGYYSRAKYLHQSARRVRDKHHGKIPAEIAALVQLPGIGRSTAGAILALCYEKPFPILDGNVKRVLTRYFNIAGWPGKSQVEKKLWKLSERLLPAKQIADYTQSLMDLGALICTIQTPDCAVCPVRNNCQARIANKIALRPGKKPAVSKPQRSVIMLIITVKDSVLLVRRPPTGIWAGLMCFPEFTRFESMEIWCRKQLKASYSINEWAVFKHTFTHFHLIVTPIHINLPAKPKQGVRETSYVWCKMYAQLAVPAPVKKLLQKLQ